MITISRLSNGEIFHVYECDSYKDLVCHIPYFMIRSLFDGPYSICGIIKETIIIDKGKNIDISNVKGYFSLYWADRLIVESKRKKRLAMKTSKRRAYSRFRAISTFNERRQNSFLDPDDCAPRPRAKRNHKNVPNNWDDIHSHVDKSWKTQSKRRNQWKVKEE